MKLIKEAMKIVAGIAGSKNIEDPALTEKLEEIDFYEPGLPDVKVYGSRTVYWLNTLKEVNKWQSYSRGDSAFRAKKHFEAFIDVLGKAFSVDIINHEAFDFCNVSTLRDSSAFGSFLTNVDEYPDLLTWGNNLTEGDNLKFSSSEDFEANKKHVLASIRYPDKEFHYFQWHKRFYWSNENGAHHSAAIIRQAEKQNLSFPIRCSVQYHKVDSSELKRVDERFKAIVIGREEGKSTKYRSTSDLLFELHKLGVDFVYFTFPVGKSNDATLVLFDTDLLGASKNLFEKWLSSGVDNGLMVDFRDLVGRWSEEPMPSLYSKSG